MVSWPEDAKHIRPERFIYPKRLAVAMVYILGLIVGGVIIGASLFVHRRFYAGILFGTGLSIFVASIFLGPPL